MRRQGAALTGHGEFQGPLRGRDDRGTHNNVRFHETGQQAELARRMVERRPDVEASAGPALVTVDLNDETVLYFIETFPTRLPRTPI